MLDLKISFEIMKIFSKSMKNLENIKVIHAIMLKTLIFLTHWSREILDNDSEFSEMLKSFDDGEEEECESDEVGEKSQREHEPRVNMVSKEVRSWLETTFTKQAALQHNIGNSPRLTFKQAAIKIKARIKLHR